MDRHNLEADLTAKEREAVRDYDACAWGSLDVSREELHSRLDALSRREWKRVRAVMLERVEALWRLREALEDCVARLQEWK